MIIEKFPEEYIELNKELCTGYHPKLAEIISKIGMDDLDLKLANIAAYCAIALDGEYRLEDRVNLCRILTKELVKMREYPKANPQVIIH